MKRGLLSIVIPVYNCENYIDRCINSILNQEYKNMEIIIVDDGSLDKSFEKCQKYAEIDSRIILIKKQNTGVSDTRNIGIEKSSGEYITFVDADDWIDRNYYIDLVSNLEKYNAEIAIGNYYLEYENNNSNEEETKEPILKELNQKEFLEGLFEIDGYRGFLWNKVYRKEIFNYRLNTKINMCEDLLANVYISNNIRKAVYSSKKMYHYFQRSGSSMNSNINLSEITVMDAYKEIMELIKNKKLKNLKNIQKTLLIHALKCKIMLEQLEKQDDYRYQYCIDVIKKYYRKDILKSMSMNQRMKTIILKRLGKIYIFFIIRQKKK